MIRQRLYLEWSLVALAAGLFIWLASIHGRLAFIDHKIYDVASQLITPQADDAILIVEIDEASLKALGRWPWPRREHARLLGTLATYRPVAIAYDVLFLEPSADDAALAAALANAAPVFLPALQERDAAGRVHGITRPPPLLVQSAAGIGAAELVPDGDGVIRRADSAGAKGQGALPSLTALMLGRFTGASPNAASANSPFLINYAGRDSFRRVSFADLAAGEVPRALVYGKLIMVGATAAGLGDVHSVPERAGGLLSGAEIQANIVNTQLTHSRIRTLPPPLAALLAMIPLALLMAGFLRLTPAASFALAIALGVAMLGVSAAALVLAHLWIAPAVALTALAMAYVLWGWRRLAAMNAFIIARTSALASEPGIVLSPRLSAQGGDFIANEANRLDHVIEQLRSLRNFVSEAVEALPAAICVVRPDGGVVLANRAAAALFGESATGRQIDQLTALVMSAQEGENGLLRDAAGRSFLKTSSSLPDGYEIVSFADVSELRRIADERDDILQFLSHDIRSPNAAIVTLLETEQIAGGPSGALPLSGATIEHIRAHARHALRLADDFVQLARARRRSITFEPVDLSDIAREAADMVWPRASLRGVTMHEGSGADEIWIMGDRSMVLRAAINLLENAVKFAPPDATVIYTVAAEGEQAVLSVSGPGPAMPPGRQAAPFALYADGRPADGTGSVGLGLAFVQTTALRHGGEASHTYHDGFGSEFRITLPLASPED